MPNGTPQYAAPTPYNPNNPYTVPNNYGSSLDTSGNNLPNFLGGGMYGVSNIPINSSAFNNPLGAQAGGQLSNELNNYLGNTTKPVVAASAAQGPTAGYNAGINGLTNLAGQYGKMAAGQGPSLATITAQQQGQSNLQSAESMLGSARG